MTPAQTPIDLENWTTQLRKGLLELCIFNLLAGGEMYGYDLVKRLAEFKGMVVTVGTIYPLLSRLKKAGLLDTTLRESSAGPARRYYSLTPAGRRLMKQMNLYWKDLVSIVDSLIDPEETHA